MRQAATTSTDEAPPAHSTGISNQTTPSSSNRRREAKEKEKKAAKATHIASINGHDTKEQQFGQVLAQSRFISSISEDTSVARASTTIMKAK